MISAADNQSQIVIAIADAMKAHNAAYINCGILHGNISNRTILFRDMANGVTGVLAGFDYASFVGDGAGAPNMVMPEPMLFQSILSWERPEVPRTRLDDWESLLYVVFWLGTFGINQAERDILNNDPSTVVDISYWNRMYEGNKASARRGDLNDRRSFQNRVYSSMRPGPLRHLALDMHEALFLHADCSGAYPELDKDFNFAGPDPLVLRNAFEDKIVANLLDVLARHRIIALAELKRLLPTDGPSTKRKLAEIP
ncbi:hypothetical protein GGI00_003467 [Coemansia sp. RSA 2681]|nr:hypothetical protein GGI00_003467 [Coemansia sp. RSA 2681]